MARDCFTVNDSRKQFDKLYSKIMHRYENPDQYDQKEIKKTIEAVKLLITSKNLFYLSDKPNIQRLLKVYENP